MALPLQYALNYATLVLLTQTYRSMRYIRSLILSGLSLWLFTPLLAQPLAETSYFEQAQLLREDGQLARAAYYARRAITASQQQQQWHRYAYELGWLGNTYRQENQYDSALHYLEKALLAVTVNQIPDTTTAITYHYLGLYYEYTNQPEQALQMHQQALELRETLEPTQPMAVATSYQSLADVHRYLYYDYTAAEEYYLKVLAIYDRFEEVSQERTLTILHNLATTNRLKNNYEKALEFGFRALAIAKNLESIDRELCYHILGNIFHSQGDNKRAISFYRRAIALAEIREERRSPSLPRLYNNLSLAYLETDSIETAIQVLSRSLTLYKTLTATTLQEDRADTYECLGNAYTKNNQFDSAKLCYRRSLQLNHQTFGKKNPQISETLEVIAEFHEKQQHYDSALFYYQHALIAGVPLFDQTDWQSNPTIAMMRNDPLVFRLLAKKGNALVSKFRRLKVEKEEFLHHALAAFLLADSLIDICRVSYDREMAKLRLMGENREFYDQAIQCAYLLHQLTRQPDYIAIAFAMIEKSKAMILWEALTAAQVKHTIGIPDSILRIEQRLKTQAAYFNSLWIEEMNTAQPDDKRLTQLRADQYKIGKQQDALVRVLQQRYPQYFTIKYQADAQLLSTAQTYAANHNTTLIDYFWGNEYVYAVGVDADGARLTRVPITDSLMYTLATYQLALANRPSQTLSKREYKAFTTAAHTLYQCLLSPFLPQRTVTKKGFFDSFRETQNENDIRPLTIIPDGSLSFLPFESLLTVLPNDSVFNFKHLDYLLRTYSIGYAQSLRVLTQRTGLSDQKRAAIRMMAFSYSDSVTSPAASRSALQSLPGSSKEIDALQAMAEVNVFKGKRATEHQFKTYARHYNIIHLAVHGQANKENPNNNRLLFRPESDSVEDGSLYSYELYELQLQADLAVLSTCESGMGKLQPGEGVYSLARGFAYAGCPSVVMSLWKVDDRQTARIMPHFYRTLLAGTTKDNALRAAKLHYLGVANSYHAHPYFWSAFILEGTSSAVISYQASRWAFWIIALLAVIYLGLFLRDERMKRRKMLAVTVNR